MLTLIHAPHSRSTRIIALLKELDALDRVEVRPVEIQRQGQDRPFAGDARNPHPEGKVPVLLHDGVEIWESPAIIQYLTDLFPERGIGAPIGSRERGRYLSWLSWYGDVVEPVLLLAAIRVEHPFLSATFRGVAEMEARLGKALENAPYLLGDRYSAADLLLHTPFVWFSEAMPANPAIRDWVRRCTERPSSKFAAEYDASLLAAA
ncbi:MULTISPECIES: glutathione S-transferase family protein [Lysobacter]|uniref:Glutathione S-transferase family protein n=1 Tax=Lysobacter firmicutimachus TaxID=1792846 RepID=A0ABU8D947_9GAMM|nr:glutathione S-transferase family protein [Lysobacter antibioticus]